MVRRKEKGIVLKLRSEGLSYSQIKEKTGISKSTLSSWLCNNKLSDKRIKELRDNSSRRIESFRKTMLKKRNARLEKVFEKVRMDVSSLTDREIFLAGLFLYWGEGGKTARYNIAISNTNPKMMRFAVRWLGVLGVSKENMSVKLHLYKDMNIKKEISFWSNNLNIPLKNFYKPYIKDSRLSSITYTNGFSHGTCCITVQGRDLAEYVHMGLKYIEDI